MHFIKSLLIATAVVASAASFELKSSKYFYEPLEAIELTCGDHQWDDQTKIVFYQNNYETPIFDSSAIANQTHFNACKFFYFFIFLYHQIDY